MYRFKGTLDSALGSLTFTFENIPAGAYKIQLSNIAATIISSSYAGGKLLYLTGEGWDIYNLENNKIKVCNQPCKVVKAISG